MRSLHWSDRDYDDDDDDDGRVVHSVLVSSKLDMST